MAKYNENFPKTFPKWNENYPCPNEITLYITAHILKRYNRQTPTPALPDFKRIFIEYNDAQ